MERRKRIEEIKAGLTVKQAAFAEEYLLDLNGKQAAIRAGYREKGAAVEASRLLTHPNVSELVALLKQERSEATAVTAERVVAELAKMAFADESKVRYRLGPKGEQLDLIPEVDEKIKIKALELLGKHTAAFTENLNLTTNGKDLPGPTTVVEVAINHRRKAAPLTEPSDEDLLE